MTVGYRLSLRNVASEVASLLGSSDPATEAVLRRGVTRAQAVFRGLRDRQIFCNRLRDSAYRERVAFEILSTEQTYVDSLAICVDVYLRPLEVGLVVCLFVSNFPFLSSLKSLKSSTGGGGGGAARGERGADRGHVSGSGDDPGLKPAAPGLSGAAAGAVASQHVRRRRFRAD